jgi:hypothetical protein
VTLRNPLPHLRATRARAPLVKADEALGTRGWAITTSAPGRRLDRLSGFAGAERRRGWLPPFSESTPTWPGIQGTQHRRKSLPSRRGFRLLPRTPSSFLGLEDFRRWSLRYHQRICYFTNGQLTLALLGRVDGKATGAREELHCLFGVR